MKKLDHYEKSSFIVFSKRTIRIMRLTLFLSLFTVCQLWATETYSQITKITVNLENQRIADVLLAVENQSEFYFLYSPKLIDVEKTVTITVEKQPISEILREIFGDDVK